MNNSRKDSIEIRVKLKKIQETAFFIDSVLLNDINEESMDKNFDIEIGYNLHKHDEQNKIELNAVARYFHFCKENTENENINPIKKKILEIETSNLFEFDDLHKYLTFKEDNKLVDSSGTLPLLLSISIGALRGILVTKTVGTSLTNYPLPIINTEVFIKKDYIENTPTIE